jgi:hypothetical protein
MDASPIALRLDSADLLVEAASFERVDELKRDIALKQYDVDAGVVADAIVSKLRLVKRGRRALDLPVADRSPSAPERPPRHG